MKKRLCPCPRCGSGSVRLLSHHRTCYFVHCMDCMKDGPAKESAGEAREAWDAQAKAGVR